MDLETITDMAMKTFSRVQWTGNGGQLYKLLPWLRNAGGIGHHSADDIIHREWDWCIPVEKVTIQMNNR
jgi:hypothetical protein